MDKAGAVLKRLDDLIKELHWARTQDGWKDKSVVEAMTLLVQARALLNIGEKKCERT